MSKEHLTEHMKARYETRLQELKEALDENIDLPFAAFCREKELDARSFTSWLSVHKRLTPRDIKNEVRKSKGMGLIKSRGQPEYDKHLQAYKHMLQIDLDYTLTQYCADVGRSAHAFHHWVMRQGLTVDKLKEEACSQVGITPVSKDARPHLKKARKQTEPTVFRKAIAGYKKMLETDHELTLQKFCSIKGYAYKPLLHWMYELGVKPADIKAFVIERTKLPKDNRRVFIQFKPNGASSSDVLNGVRISLPDGTRVDVESCTVVGLCSFVNVYSKQNVK